MPGGCSHVQCQTPLKRDVALHQQLSRCAGEAQALNVNDASRQPGTQIPALKQSRGLTGDQRRSYLLQDRKLQGLRLPERGVDARGQVIQRAHVLAGQVDLAGCLARAHLAEVRHLVQKRLQLEPRKADLTVNLHGRFPAQHESPGQTSGCRLGGAVLNLHLASATARGERPGKRQTPIGYLEPRNLAMRQGDFASAERFASQYAAHAHLQRPLDASGQGRPRRQQACRIHAIGHQRKPASLVAGKT